MRLELLQGGLIVSCQAPKDSPMHDPHVIAAMALTAQKRGAVAVRIESPAHIEAVRRLVSIPIIGLWKRTDPASSVYITPTFEDAQAVVEAGADIVALDATERPRVDGVTIQELLPKIRKKLAVPVMADIASVEEGKLSANLGAELIGTTLYGYTETTQNFAPPGFDLLHTLATQLSVPIVCEGGIATPEDVAKAYQLGAFSVVVGTAITGIDVRVATFCKATAPFESKSHFQKNE
jgi:N-acylglucosamine-6-phosphate 2-epimerase